MKYAILHNLSTTINTKLLDDQDVLTAVFIVSQFNKCNTGHSSSINKWKQSVRSWQHLLSTIGRKRAKDSRFLERAMTDQLQSMESLVQREPYNICHSQSMYQAKDQLRKLQQTKIAGAKVRARINWLQQGDRGSKFFYNMLRQKEYREKIDTVG